MDSYSTDLIDSSLPVELRAHFQPLYCKLCCVQLSSNVDAKIHYSSKNHDKKVKKFLIEYSERTGEPLHKRAKIQKTKTNEVRLVRSIKGNRIITQEMKIHRTY